MENKFKPGDYVRYQNQNWYIKSMEGDEYGNWTAILVNIKTRIQDFVVLKNGVIKLSDLEVTFLKHRNLIPKRDLVEGDKFQFIISELEACIHGNCLEEMGYNTNDIYIVHRVYTSYGKCIITNIGYYFSMLEVRLVEE